MWDMLNHLLAFALFFGAFIAAMQLLDEPEIARRTREAATRTEE